MNFNSTKSKISKEFSRLRNFGFRVYNFNAKKSILPGLKAFCDYLILSESHCIFIEVKIGRDSFNPEQKKLRSMIDYLSTKNKSIFYFLVTNQKEAASLVDQLLNNSLAKIILKA